MRSDDPNGFRFHPGISAIPPKAPDPVVVDSEKKSYLFHNLSNLVVDDADENGSSFGARYDLC